MPLSTRTHDRIPATGVLLALALGALLLWPTVVLGDSLSRTAAPAQYRGPSGDVPGRFPPMLEPPASGGDAARSPEGWARWEFWFEYEKDSLLRLAMASPRGAAVTGPSLPDGAPPAIAALTDADRRERVLPALRAALRDPSAAVRSYAALALGSAKDRTAILALAEMLRAGPAVDRRSAALALGFLGEADGVAPLAQVRRG